LEYLLCGAVAEWVWKVIGGINPDDAKPGFKNVIIKPEPGGGLTNAVTSLNSVRGPIVTSWTNNLATTNYILNVTVPANAAASIYIPSTNLVTITESGVSATSAPGVQSYYFTNWPNWSNGATVFQVGAGTYQFMATGVTF
jgi:alpha-L-rhamnosidase